MNPKNTWVWMLVAAALLGLIFLSKQFAPKPATGPAPILPDIKAATTFNIQVTPAGQLKIRAERTNAAWQLVNPISYPAQGGSIESLLTALEQLTAAARISGGEMRRPDADAVFGFDTPQFALTIQNRDVERRIKVGARTASGDQVYLQIIGVEGAFVVDADWLKFIPRQADDWRELSLIDLRSLVFDRVVISNATAQFELQRAPTNFFWSLSRPLAARADNDRFIRLLQGLHMSRVSRFVTDDPNADRQPFGLQPPELQIVLALGTNRLVRLDFGKTTTNASQIYVGLPDRGGVVTVPRELLAPWYEPSEKFRDHRLLTLGRPVDQIEVRGGDGFTLQRQAGNSWKLAGQDFPVDAGLVNDFIKAPLAMPILQFVDAIIDPELQTYGLAPPARQIIFRSAVTNGFGTTNLTLAELSFGATNGNTIYVRRADEKPVYAVGLADFQKMPSLPLEFRERRIWKFSVDAVTRLTIRTNDLVRELVHTGTNSWKFAQRSEAIVNGPAVEETAFRFGQLTAAWWVERGATDLARYGIGTNGLSLRFELDNGEKREIQFGQSEYPVYAAVKLDGQTWVFEFPLDLYHNLVKPHLTIPANAP